MRANVVRDKTTRVVELDIKADNPAWDLVDHSATWRDKPQTFRPDHARVVLEKVDARWRLLSIQVSGYLVLKSGAVSEHKRDSAAWQGADGWRYRIGTAPSWVQRIANTVREGKSAFSWADPANTEEVQKL
jgi:hypothetical protein